MQNQQEVLLQTQPVQSIQLNWSESTYWRDAKKLLLSERPELKDLHLKSFQTLNSYDLVYVVTDENSNPLKFNIADSSVVFCFTNPSLAKNYRKEVVLKLLGMDKQNNILRNQAQLKHFMLGNLCKELATTKTPTPILINPIELEKEGNSFYLAEEVIFAPIFDELTKKMMMTDPSEALPLLAINPEDQARIGIEVIFHMITNQFTPEMGVEREQFLKHKIEELSFLVPRVPICQGSGSIYCVLLNLENAMEELAFIRQYNTFDPYSDVIFVMSDLKLLTGSLSEIAYDGEHVDTIFAPIIDWQKSNNSFRNYYLNAK